MGGADVLRFGPFELDPARSRLYRDGRRVGLPHAHIDLLHTLALRRGEVLSRRLLVEVGWQGVSVSLNNVDQVVGRLRKELGEQDSGAPYIETIKGQGYRFIAPVEMAERHDADAPFDSLLAPYRAFAHGRAALDTLDIQAIRDARRAFEDVLQVAPDYAPAHVGLAHACSLLFEATRADAEPDMATLKHGISHARRGCELDPSWAEAWSTLGLLLFQNGDTADAVAASCRATDLDPEDWRHWLRLAFVSWGEERLRGARRVLALCPGLALAYWLIATVFIARSAFDAALDVLADGCAAQDAQSNARFPAVGLHLLRALVLDVAGQRDAAIAALERELACTGSLRQLYARECIANTWYTLGALHLHDGRHRDAETAFRQALTTIPRHAFAAAALGLDEASCPPPRFDPNTIDAAMAQAIRLARSGRYPDAAGVCAEALAAAPHGYAGWQLPVDPVLRTAMHPDVWAQTLVLVRDRAT